MAEVLPSMANAAPTVQSSSDKQRVATHSHIRGLGLQEDGTAMAAEGGFIGQTSAREAAGVIVDLVKSRRMAGRAVLIAGEPGTGKTALALAMSQELGGKTPFRPMVGSEVFSAEVKKTEVLTENMRRAIGLRIKEIKEVFEGEVVEILPQEREDASDGRILTSVSLTLRTAKGSKTIKLEPSVYHGLTRAKISVGDVIYVEANSGTVKRLGRADSYKAEYDLEADEFVPLPKGEVHKKREVVQDVTLHDLDVANARPTASSASGGDLSSSALLGQLLKSRGKTEITEKLRREINKIVNNYIEQGVAELVPGVLFIDEAHILDLECFAFLNRAIESSLAPLLVLATNRGMSAVRGTENFLSPHGIPRELLDRLLIIRTAPCAPAEACKIIALRAKAEALLLAEDALHALAEIAAQSSLRYAIQLLTPAAVTASIQGRTDVLPQDIADAAALFLDTKRSTQLLLDNEALYVTQ